MSKKYFIVLLSVALIICLFGGCASSNSDNETDTTLKQLMTETDLNSKIHAMSNLATLEVKYHNVAETVVPAGTGIQAWGEKDRKFWIEYESSVRIGIDASKITATIKDNTVTINIPDAEILSGTDWDSKNAQTFYSPDSINSNKFTPQHKDDTVNSGQENMRKEILQNNTLMTRAKDNAKKIIETFVKKMGEINGVEYHIVWTDITK